LRLGRHHKHPADINATVVLLVRASEVAEKRAYVLDAAFDLSERARLTVMPTVTPARPGRLAGRPARP
jgi:hypothetical protein